MFSKKLLSLAEANMKAVQGGMKNGFASAEDAVEKAFVAYTNAYGMGKLTKKHTYSVVVFSEEKGYGKGVSYDKPTVRCEVWFTGGKATEAVFTREFLHPGQRVWSKVFTYGYEARKAALRGFLGTDHPMPTGEGNMEFDMLLQGMRDFAVYG